MFRRPATRAWIVALITIELAAFGSSALAAASWSGILNDGAGKPLAAAVVKLHSPSGGHDYAATTAANGGFSFEAIRSGSYELSVRQNEKEWKAPDPFVVTDESVVKVSLHVTSGGRFCRA